MADPWTSYIGLVPPTCVVCCTPPVPPLDCPCLQESVYYNGGSGLLTQLILASLADAELVVSALTSGCVALFRRYAGTFTAINADASVSDALAISFDASVAAFVGSSYSSATVSISVKEGTTLTINYDRTGGTGDGTSSAYLFTCDDLGTRFMEADSSDVSGTLVLSSIPAGTYYLTLVTVIQVGSGAASVSGSYDVSADDVMIVNPLSIYWDDSGTTTGLEACPRLLVPILTEATADWFANETDANSFLAGPLVSNCVGVFFFNNDTFIPDSFTATDGGASLGLNADATDFPVAMWGSDSAVEGETLGIAYTCSGTAAGTGFIATARLEIYDDTGTLIFSDFATNGGASISGTFTSSALPYTGRYLVKVRFDVSRDNPDPYVNTNTGTFTITSSGDMTVNPVRALYDRGLECPAWIECEE